MVTDEGDMEMYKKCLKLNILHMDYTVDQLCWQRFMQIYKQHKNIYFTFFSS